MARRKFVIIKLIARETNRIPKLDVRRSNPSPASNSDHHSLECVEPLIVQVQQFSTPPCSASARQSIDSNPS
jgi:hypothetical protein